VAAWLLTRGHSLGAGNDVDELTFALRATGIPYVWPAAWSRSWKDASSESATEQSFIDWLETLEPGPLRRCGLARVDREGGDGAMAAVATKALADLAEPLPTTARLGQWLNFSAVMRVAVTQPKVVLLPPTGEPMTVPTYQSGATVRARFAAGSPGKWLVQLLASGETGPRPMLEAVLFVDMLPTEHFQDQVAPGESATRENSEAADVSLARMVSALRQETGRPAMRRDPILDRVASAHARVMRERRRIGHDVGDGPTHQRLADADFAARLAGENVAHAGDAVRVHRALWASPSHRFNLLHRGFSRWGLGVAEDSDGSLWVCELFASER
jgi:uncharacterized protein YkwD